MPWPSARAKARGEPSGCVRCATMMTRDEPPTGLPGPLTHDERHLMSKRARKRRSRKGNKANHGRKPNA